VSKLSGGGDKMKVVIAKKEGNKYFVFTDEKETMSSELCLSFEDLVWRLSLFFNEKLEKGKEREKGGK